MVSFTYINHAAFESQFKQIMPECMYNSSTYVEDAVWTLAHAVNNCISTTGSDGTCNTKIRKFISNFTTSEVNY